MTHNTYTFSPFGYTSRLAERILGTDGDDNRAKICCRIARENDDYNSISDIIARHLLTPSPAFFISIEANTTSASAAMTTAAMTTVAMTTVAIETTPLPQLIPLALPSALSSPMLRPLPQLPPPSPPHLPNQAPSLPPGVAQTTSPPLLPTSPIPHLPIPPMRPWIRKLAKWISRN